MDSVDILKYIDDTDRCYGVAGMALAAFILDYEKYIDSVSVERRGLDAVDFTPEFFMASSESISPKASWEHTLEQFQVVSSMLISNMMCRSMVRNHRELQQSHHDAMLEALTDFACDCQLADEETRQIFDKHYMYLDRAYHNSRLHDAAQRLVDEFASRPTLYHSDLCEALGDF